MTRIILGVRGMKDETTAAKVKTELMALKGVSKVDAKPDGQAAVEYDAGMLTTMDLIRALRHAGFVAGME